MNDNEIYLEYLWDKLHTLQKHEDDLYQTMVEDPFVKSVFASSYEKAKYEIGHIECEIDKIQKEMKKETALKDYYEEEHKYPSYNLTDKVVVKETDHTSMSNNYNNLGTLVSPYAVASANTTGYIGGIGYGTTSMPLTNDTSMPLTNDTSMPLLSLEDFLAQEGPKKSKYPWMNEYGVALQYNPLCMGCLLENKYCGKCPNPECENCIEIKKNCGYCNFNPTGEVFDHVSHVQKMLDEQGLSDEWEIVVADSTHLQVDCDDSAALDHCKIAIKMLSKQIDIKSVRYTKSKGGNTHCIVELVKPASVWKRIALQAALGSDPMRELLSAINVMKKHKDPILLIEAKEEFRDEQEEGLEEL